VRIIIRKGFDVYFGEFKENSFLNILKSE